MEGSHGGSQQHVRKTSMGGKHFWMSLGVPRGTMRDEMRLDETTATTLL